MATVVGPDVFRDPARLRIPVESWVELPPDDKETYYATCDRELDEIGILVVANALSDEDCDEFIAIIDDELARVTNLERVMHQRQAESMARGGPGYGKKLYNFQSRHQKAMDLIAFPFLVDYFRRFLGADMELHSSEGAVVTPGASGGGLHHDGRDRVPGHFFSLNSIYYLVDSDESNGATRYVPGTHKDFITIAEAQTRPARYVDVKKGDLVIFNPCLIHSGSPNRSNANRPVIINYYQRGNIKPGFDYPRAMSVAEIKRLTPTQRQLLGFNFRVPLDERELYTFRPELGDLDPLEPKREHYKQA
jgi:ectoine hydroxylase-related dioxygenase (phytanoyl-CoA dioxygenase family)